MFKSRVLETVIVRVILLNPQRKIDDHRNVETDCKHPQDTLPVSYSIFPKCCWLLSLCISLHVLNWVSIQVSYGLGYFHKGCCVAK